MPHIHPIKDRSRKPTEHDIDLFFKKVSKTDSCWIWKGGKSIGYGMFNWHGWPIRSHQMSWIIHNGPIPEGYFVCHNCPDGDNRLCVNPRHLFLGTNQENLMDAFKKGRIKKGAEHGMARFSEADVIDMRSLRRIGFTLQAIADQFKTGSGTVSRIVNKVRWKHIV